MGRWEPDARSRLEEAALFCYFTNGFDQTTVAEIAARAGLTERTYFRHFADKREVLFGGAVEFQGHITRAVASAPSGMGPLDAALEGLAAAGALLQPWRSRAVQRNAVVTANVELQERELVKLAGLALAIGGVLRDRGTPDAVARLTGEVAVAAFRTAFDRWVHADADTDLATLVRASRDELEVVTQR